MITSRLPAAYLLPLYCTRLHTSVTPDISVTQDIGVTQDTNMIIKQQIACSDILSTFHPEPNLATITTHPPFIFSGAVSIVQP